VNTYECYKLTGLNISTKCKHI